MTPVRSSHQNGFTLIEILLVMAIIAIIGGLFMGNFFSSLTRARDARRKEDLSQIQKSLEMYKSDLNPPAYPASGFFDSSLCNKCWSQDNPDCNVNIYMHKVPCDPQDDSPYIYNLDLNDDLRFNLSACLENSEDLNRDSTPVAECANLNKQSYTVHEP